MFFKPPYFPMKNQDSFMPTFKLGLKKYGKLEKLDGIGPILYQKRLNAWI
jgi:hypothetical protein